MRAVRGMPIRPMLSAWSSSLTDSSDTREQLEYDLIVTWKRLPGRLERGSVNYSSVTYQIVGRA